MPKHWTEVKKKSKPSLYRQTIGNPFLRAVAIQALFGDLHALEAQGKKDGGYWRKIKNDLISLGEGDYTPADEGMHWSDNPR